MSNESGIQPIKTATPMPQTTINEIAATQASRGILLACVSIPVRTLLNEA